MRSEGYAILSAIPSCTLMFKQELPLMFPDCADTQAVKEAMFDPFEYLVARHKDGLLKLDFKAGLGKVSYHIPCHGRVQNIGRKTEEMFKLIGQTVQLQLNTVERCSGHAGTYGVKTRTHPMRDEDRQAGVQVHGQGRARLHQQRLRAGRPPHRAGHGAGRHAGEGAAASVEPGAHGLRTGVNATGA